MNAKLGSKLCFEYQIVLLGFSNILKDFYDYIKKILVKNYNIFIIIYIDNIFIYIKNSNQASFNTT